MMYYRSSNQGLLCLNEAGTSIWRQSVCWPLDPSIQQVIMVVLKPFRLPTSTNTIKGHSNSQPQRVYIYPILASISDQIQNGLREIPVISFLRSVCNKLYNPIFFGLRNMTTSPNSVLEPAFQCEAIPICVEERPSSSLVQALHRTLAGRLLTAKRPSIPSLTLAVSILLICNHRLSCYDHGKCLYSFEFTFAPDVEKVVAGGPWYINGDLLLISRMNPNQAIEQLPFPFTKLWVRCYDLPPKCFTKEYAEAIGNSLGRFCETDLPPEDPDEAKLLVQKFPTVRKYLRVKFEFNLYGPLKSSQSIKICNSKKTVMEEHISRLTYERLPHTCFRCGFLGHLAEECSFEGPLLYGEWIRAERFFRINLQNITIPKVISTSKVGQSSISQRIENQAIQVNNVADLVSTMISDPSIIKADFSVARTEGPLPSSKGKAPLLASPQSKCLIPFSSGSPPNAASSKTVYGPPAESIMGPVPLVLRSQRSPLAAESILVESDEGQFVSFLNSIAALEEGSTVPNRCLFPNPTSSAYVNSRSSPTTLSPIQPLEGASASGHISSVFKEELRKLPTGRKRAPGNPQTPGPKRGRQTSNPDDQA